MYQDSRRRFDVMLGNSTAVLQKSEKSFIVATKRHFFLFRDVTFYSDELHFLAENENESLDQGNTLCNCMWSLFFLFILCYDNWFRTVLLPQVCFNIYLILPTFLYTNESYIRFKSWNSNNSAVKHNLPSHIKVEWKDIEANFVLGGTKKNQLISSSRMGSNHIFCEFRCCKIAM